MSNEDSKKVLHDAVEELDAAREAARLKLHLISMDAKSAWDDLEGKAKELKERLAKQGDKAAETSATAARDLARSIRKFVEKHV